MQIYIKWKISEEDQTNKVNKTRIESTKILKNLHQK